MHQSLKLITPPAALAVTLEDMKRHLRVTITEDDTLISACIAAATRSVESFLGRQLLTATYRRSLDRFPLLPNSQFAPGNPNVHVPVLNNLWPLNPCAWAIELMPCPVIAVSSIQYVDNTGATQTMDPATYLLDTDSEPARITPAAGSYWPQTRWQPNAVQVTFTAGYDEADSAAVPANFLAAIRLLAADYYEHREASITGTIVNELPTGVQFLLWPDRIKRF